jgi:hypothetical protein
LASLRSVEAMNAQKAMVTVVGRATWPGAFDPVWVVGLLVGRILHRSARRAITLAA